MQDAGAELLTLSNVFTQKEVARRIDWKIFASELKQFLTFVNETKQIDSITENSRPVWDILNSYYVPQYKSQAIRYGVEKGCEKVLVDVPVFEEPLDGCLIHGDLWPNSILLDQNTRTFWVVDWELARISYPTSDLEQFLSNLWIMREGNPSLYDTQSVSTLMNEMGSWDCRGDESRLNCIRWILVLLQYPHWKITMDPRELVLKALKEI
jgi:thiamine kinase-like enzyme